jgi:hypothetical protein
MPPETTHPSTCCPRTRSIPSATRPARSCPRCPSSASANSLPMSSTSSSAGSPDSQMETCRHGRQARPPASQVALATEGHLIARALPTVASAAWDPATWARTTWDQVIWVVRLQDPEGIEGHRPQVTHAMLHEEIHECRGLREECRPATLVDHFQRLSSKTPSYRTRAQWSRMTTMMTVPEMTTLST